MGLFVSKKPNGGQMRVAVIGGGWYGCHVASRLKALGINFRMYEADSSLFSKASGKNQFRLHQGFHYARNFRTRHQSKEGFEEFLEQYGLLTQTVNSNLYIVPKNNSLIDFKTYMSIMMSSGIDFQILSSPPVDIRGVEGIISVDERVILTSKAKEFFFEKLRHNLQLNTEVKITYNCDGYVELNGWDRFDYAIDCTWGTLRKNSLPSVYEPTILLYYKARDVGFPALTFVDGDLMSLYPTESNEIYTLSSVRHTPLGKFDSIDAARSMISELNFSKIQEKILAMEGELKIYLPNFSDFFSFVEPQLSIKTKLVGMSDDRSCYVYKDGRVLSIFSGKIDNIFYAANKVLQYLDAD